MTQAVGAVERRVEDHKPASRTRRPAELRVHCVRRAARGLQAVVVASKHRRIGNCELAAQAIMTVIAIRTAPGCNLSPPSHSVGMMSCLPMLSTPIPHLPCPPEPLLTCPPSLTQPPPHTLSTAPHLWMLVGRAPCIRYTFHAFPYYHTAAMHWSLKHV